MKVQVNTNNWFQITGHIIRINPYGKNNAVANVIIGMSDDNDGAKSVKFFNKDVIPLLKERMPVLVVGHIGSNCYTDQQGQKKYRDNNDLIADVIEILESKKESKAREMEDLYN